MDWWMWVIPAFVALWACLCLYYQWQGWKEDGKLIDDVNAAIEKLQRTQTKWEKRKRAIRLTRKRGANRRAVRRLPNY